MFQAEENVKRGLIYEKANYQKAIVVRIDIFLIHHNLFHVHTNCLHSFYK